MLNILKGVGVAFMLAFAAIVIAMYSGYDSGVLQQMLHSVPHGDKIAHFFTVGLLAFFANILLDRKKTDFFITPVLLGSALVLAFSSLDELAQMFVAHRNCELLDFVANCAGIFVFTKLGEYIPDTLLPRRMSIIP